MTKSLVVVVIGILVVACGEPIASTDPGDAGVLFGSHPDAGNGAPDAGHEHDAGTSDDTDDAGIEDDDTDAGVSHPTLAECFEGISGSTGTVRGPDYDQFHPHIGTHCVGTNNQNITGVQRVVFLGDSVTVGTPPTPSADFFRSRLADSLSQKFSLEAPNGFWKTASILNGTAGVMHSGDFWSCAKWGARTDDLVQDNSQVNDCFPVEERNKHTLVVMTIGSNDISSLAKSGIDAPIEESWLAVEGFVQRMRDAVTYLKDTSVFPGGVDVIFANNYEFTDGTGDVSSCPAAAAGGFDTPWEDPNALAILIVWATEQYMKIAIDTNSDMLFMLETFCGHGYHFDDPNNGCYRGPDSERWFDITCIHPTPTGHQQIADMIMQIVNE